MHGASESVFVETVAKVTPCEEDVTTVLASVEARQFLLGRDGLEAEERMGVRDLAVENRHRLHGPTFGPAGARARVVDHRLRNAGVGAGLSGSGDQGAKPGLKAYPKRLGRA